VWGLSLGVYRLVEVGDAGTALSLAVGERLMVALPGNPSTGYTWEVQAEPSVVRAVPGLGFLGDTTMIGAGGIFYFRYLAAAPGEDTLVLVYRRPWEPTPSDKTFALGVVVR